MMTETADLAIIGGGAAGLAAAIFAAQVAGPARQIVVLEGSRQVGTKILVSGGTRCNVTHDKVTLADYNGSRNIVKNVLAAFDAAAAVRWFASMGVELASEEHGKLFPITNSAHTVLDALVTRCRELGVQVHTGMRVRRLIRDIQTPDFAIDCEQAQMRARRVILATGGQSLPKSGSDGSGWALAKQLGHSVTPTHQALVPLVLDAAFFHAGLSGIAMDVELTTLVKGKPIDRRTGAMLWTHFGISGPAAMDASRHWVTAHDQNLQPQMRCNLLYPDGFEAVETWLITTCTARPRAAILTIVSTRLTERVAAAIIRSCHIDPATPAGQLPRDARRALVHALTALPLPILRPRGWEYAEVTAGGVPLNEIDYRTMESRKAAGLYLVGEILDCDGRIGGFNFQWAWSTAYVAGTAAGKALRAE
jgi:predicted Rossmann fold flavoprotein